jgi:copper chaperone CopZ
MNENQNCHVDPITKDVSEEEKEHITYVILAVSGMGCPTCSTRVRNSLLMLKGVVDAKVNHITNSAAVLYNPTMTHVENVVQAVSQAGNDGRHRYTAQPLFENIREEIHEY